MVERHVSIFPDLSNEMVLFRRETGPHGELSNWYPCNVWASIGGREYVYDSSEHLFMARKADHFGYSRSVARLQRKGLTAGECKAIGRGVVGFTARGWDAVKPKVMFEVVLAKFEQNRELAELLIGTGEKVIVEASPHDGVWGTRMNAADILSGKEWNGENLLGVVKGAPVCTSLVTSY